MFPVECYWRALDDLWKILIWHPIYHGRWYMASNRSNYTMNSRLHGIFMETKYQNLRVIDVLSGRWSPWGIIAVVDYLWGGWRAGQSPERQRWHGDIRQGSHRLNIHRTGCQMFEYIWHKHGSKNSKITVLEIPGLAGSSLMGTLSINVPTGNRIQADEHSKTKTGPPGAIVSDINAISWYSEFTLEIEEFG